jgi:urate oxidase
VDGKPHPHSFLRDGAETRNVEVSFKRDGGFNIRSTIQGLHVLKSTGSAFHGFYRDEYTTLGETWDRILSTEVEATWEWKKFGTFEDVKATVAKFDPAWATARQITLDTFAKDDSASVQATMYRMAQQILAQIPQLEHVSYSLPNKHYFEIGKFLPTLYLLSVLTLLVDLSWHKGLENTGKDAEVYAPQSGPSGLIKCTVSRDPTSKL